MVEWKQGLTQWIWPEAVEERVIEGTAVAPRLARLDEEVPVAATRA
jgi:hypothetical protein